MDFSCEFFLLSYHKGWEHDVNDDVLCAVGGVAGSAYLNVEEIVIHEYAQAVDSYYQ